MARDTARFLELLERQNVAIAAREVELIPHEDSVRLQREQERRDKWGQLRAREHPNHRPVRARNAFGYVDLR